MDDVEIVLRCNEWDLGLWYQVWTKRCRTIGDLDFSEPTLLHYVRTIEVTRLFLSYGAQVNGQDVSGSTPLMKAVRHNKGLEVVRELLNHGANVNMQNCVGDTALNIAIRRGDFSSTAAIIHELLEHGADINIRNPASHNRGINTPLENAMSNPQCARLLIKMTLLKNFDKNYKDIINLTLYNSWAVFMELSNFLEDCIREVTQMKADKINESLSLYEFMITKKLNTEAMLSTDEYLKKINDEVIFILNSTNYHAYHDLISDKIRLGLRDVTRETLCNGLKIYTGSDKRVRGGRVVLDYYSAHHVAKYLSNEDLFNLKIALHQDPNPSTSFVNAQLLPLRVAEFPWRTESPSWQGIAGGKFKVEYEIKEATEDERQINDLGLPGVAYINSKHMYVMVNVLHYTRIVKIAREVLLHGAPVNGTDRNGRTPLINAVLHNKGLEFVRELLKHGANVNITDPEGNTPLNLAVLRRDFSSDIIKELLEHGADINIRNSVPRGHKNHHSPLDNAVGNPQCAKLIIKLTILKNFVRNNQEIINLTPYKALPTFTELSNFYEDCIHEVTLMKADMINEYLSLYETVISNNLSTEALVLANEGFKKINDKVLVILNSTNYRVYQDIISDKIGFCLRSVSIGIFLNTLDGLNIYTESYVSNENSERKRVVLDCYSAHGVCKYLSKGELLNLAIAFSNHS
ncbi:putative ankyrin repeat protein RF_0381 [Hetaerina americana]|uniref:putative ankyrin repeat protein RF_0381 n=1 Tax=Hetaerina americana TaxID=62018 RepID=UPI003A7F1C55